MSLSLLVAVNASLYLLSNILASRMIQVGPFIMDGGQVTYPLSFLVTDLIGEIYGPEHAKKAVRIALACGILALGFATLVNYLPYPAFSQDMQTAFRQVFHVTPRITFASVVAYLCSQHLDVWLFHKIGRLSGGKAKWLRNNVSTLLSQWVDTVLFVTIAFAGQVPHLMTIVLTEYAFKAIYALLDTAFFYLLSARQPSVFDQNPLG